MAALRRFLTHNELDVVILDPTALTIGDAAKLLTKAGGRLVTEVMLQRDVDAGAPTNPNGTLNLVNYTVWLVRESRDQSREPSRRSPVPQTLWTLSSGLWTLGPIPWRLPRDHYFKQAANKKGRGLRFSKLVPPGTE